MRSGDIFSGTKDILAAHKTRFILSSLGIVFGTGSAVARSALDGILPAGLETNTVFSFSALSTGGFEQVANVVAVCRSALTITMLIFLLVGSMSILNTMLFIVEGSADEIRARRSAGARPFDLIRLFLLPPIVVCLIAGVVGIAVGALGFFGLIALMNAGQLLEGFAPVVRVGTLAKALLLCIALGIAIGLYPADRAAREFQEFL